MAAVIFTDLLNKASTLNMNTKTVEARDWFREKAQEVSSLNTQKIISQSSENSRNTFRIGRLYLFAYDAKHKDTLPYYDMFPLIFLLQPAEGGFMGLNMHYLPPMFRARLMDALYDLLNNKQMNETTKLNMTYKLLNTATKYKYFKPTLKRYLISQMKSKFIEIPPEQWEISLFLPLQKFSGATSSKVWEDSKNSVLKR